MSNEPIPETQVNLQKAGQPFVQAPETSKWIFKISDKKLRRSSTSKIIAGVCGGLAEYLGISPMIIRIVFLAFFFILGPSFLIYIFLWILIPSDKEGDSQSLQKPATSVTYLLMLGLVLFNAFIFDRWGFILSEYIMGYFLRDSDLGLAGIPFVMGMYSFIFAVYSILLLIIFIKLFRNRKIAGLALILFIFFAFLPTNLRMYQMKKETNKSIAQIQSKVNIAEKTKIEITDYKEIPEIDSNGVLEKITFQFDFNSNTEHEMYCGINVLFFSERTIGDYFYFDVRSDEELDTFVNNPELLRKDNCQVKIGANTITRTVNKLDESILAQSTGEGYFHTNLYLGIYNENSPPNAQGNATFIQNVIDVSDKSKPVISDYDLRAFQRDFYFQGNSYSIK